MRCQKLFTQMHFYISVFRYCNATRESDRERESVGEIRSIASTFFIFHIFLYFGGIH